MITLPVGEFVALCGFFVLWAAFATLGASRMQKEKRDLMNEFNTFIAVSATKLRHMGETQQELKNMLEQRTMPLELHLYLERHLRAVALALHNDPNCMEIQILRWMVRAYPGRTLDVLKSIASDAEQQALQLPQAAKPKTPNDKLN